MSGEGQEIKKKNLPLTLYPKYHNMEREGHWGEMKEKSVHAQSTGHVGRPGG